MSNLAMASIAEAGGCRPFGAWAIGIRGLSAALHHKHHLNAKRPHTMHPSVNEGWQSPKQSNCIIMIQFVSCVTVVFILTSWCFFGGWGGLSLLKTRLSGGTSGASEPSSWDTFASEAQPNNMGEGFNQTQRMRKSMCFKYRCWMLLG